MSHRYPLGKFLLRDAKTPWGLAEDNRLECWAACNFTFQA